MTLDDMQRAWLEFRRERDWEQFHDPKSQAIGLVLEAAEVAEHMQWHTGNKLQELLDENKEGLGDELVDVLSWVLLIAADQGIDLPTAFAAKMKKNAKKYPVEKSSSTATKYTSL
ncbi:MAG: MazG-like family protein [Planctomycetota bacterium]